MLHELVVELLTSPTPQFQQTFDYYHTESRCQSKQLLQFFQGFVCFCRILELFGFIPLIYFASAVNKISRIPTEEARLVELISWVVSSLSKISNQPAKLNHQQHMIIIKPMKFQKFRTLGRLLNLNMWGQETKLKKTEALPTYGPLPTNKKIGSSSLFLSSPSLAHCWQLLFGRRQG